VLTNVLSYTVDMVSVGLAWGSGRITKSSERYSECLSKQMHYNHKQCRACGNS
jgi:hypothetical protein